MCHLRCRCRSVAVVILAVSLVVFVVSFEVGGHLLCALVLCSPLSLFLAAVFLGRCPSRHGGQHVNFQVFVQVRGDRSVADARVAAERTQRSLRAR